MELNPLTFIILALASYRITRFLVFDTLFSHSRQRLYVALANKSGSGSRVIAVSSHKLLEGLSCTWCLGVYVSAAVYWLYTWQSPELWGRLGWITFAAIAGAQGLLHAFEPDGDE